MDKIETFVNRLKKIGIVIELVGNYPWVYINKINGKVVEETYCSDYGFTMAFRPVKEGKHAEFTEVREIFKLLRKYCVHYVVYNFKTKYEEGFTGEEIKSLLRKYPDIDMERFYDALHGITCMMCDGKIVTYHCDIENALKCGIEKRSLYDYEWD